MSYHRDPKKPRKRRIMREFTIEELSAVDKSAQAHARMTIMKRETDVDQLPELIAKRYLDPQDGAISFVEAVEHELADERYYAACREVQPALYALEVSLKATAVDADMDSNSKQTMMRNSVEDFLSVIRTRWPEVEEALAKNFVGDDSGDGTAIKQGDTTMTADEKKQIDDLEKSVADLTKQLAAATKGSEDATAAAKLQEELDAVTAKVAEAAAELEKAKTEAAEAATKAAEDLDKASMSAAEKEHMASLDKEGKGKFLAMSADERKKALKKSLDGDETLEVAGREIRKSVVGEDQFEIFKSQQVQIDKQSQELVKSEERRSKAELTKRAETELENLPGDLDAKIKVFKALVEMDEDARKPLEDMLEAGNKAVSAAFKQIGHGGGDGDVPAATEFNKRVAEVKKREDCSATEAMQKAREEYPDEFEAYQNSSNPAN